MEEPNQASSFSNISLSSSEDDENVSSEDSMDVMESVDQDSDTYFPEVLQNLTIEDTDGDHSEAKSNPELPIKRRFGFQSCLLPLSNDILLCSGKTAS